jgi:hypothetical protein
MALQCFFYILMTYRLKTGVKAEEFDEGKTSISQAI